MKKQIDFDFAKWGQEGISIKYNKIHDVVAIMKSTLQFTYVIEHRIDNSLGVKAIHTDKCDLTMFEEVKPREFWVNVYGDGFSFLYDTKSEAIQCLDIGGKTIKLVEVIE